MKVREEIMQYASEADKPVLLFLLNKYHWASQWRFVARCTSEQYGLMSYQTRRVWTPTVEGRCLAEYMKELT